MTTKTKASTFEQARKLHRLVDERAAYLARFGDAKDMSGAKAFWNGLTGRDGGELGDLVVETMPADVAGLVASNETATAVAWDMLTAARPWNIPGAFERREQARKDWAAFAARAQNVQHLVEGFGWDLSDAWQVEREASEREAEVVRKIAKLAGRMYAALVGSSAKAVSGIVGELYAVEQGDDLGRMLPVERLALTDPMLELALFDRIESKRMLQYSVRGQAPAAKGPVVLVKDESGSMHENRRIWANAAALAVARVARDQKRAVAVVHFSTAVVARDLDPASPASVMAMLRSHLGGGTEIGRALLEAGRQVQRLAQRGDKGADVLLVTDGIDDDEEAQRAAVAALGDARLWTVGIDTEIEPGSVLRANAAGCAHVSDAELGDERTVVALGAAARGNQ